MSIQAALHFLVCSSHAVRLGEVNQLLDKALVRPDLSPPRQLRLVLKRHLSTQRLRMARHRDEGLAAGSEQQIVLFGYFVN